MPKKYVGLKDNTREFIESEEEDLESIDVTISPLSGDYSQETSLGSISVGKHALM